MNEIHSARRRFLQLGATGLVTAFFGAFPKLGLAKLPHEKQKPVLVRESDGLHILTGRRKVPIHIKLSKEKDGISNISFCVEEMTPGRKMRIHKHLNHDEVIFIHHGEGSLTLDENVFNVKTGDVVFIPRDTWHGLDNTGSEDLKMVFQYSPAGFEQYFVENGTEQGMPAKKTPWRIFDHRKEIWNGL